MYSCARLRVESQTEGEIRYTAERAPLDDKAVAWLILILHDDDNSDGSRTITVEHDNDEGEAVETPDFDGVLRLRGGPTHGNRVTWQEGTVDNEFLNRKKSKSGCRACFKACFIHHADTALSLVSFQSAVSSTKRSRRPLKIPLQRAAHRHRHRQAAMAAIAARASVARARGTPK